MDPRGSKLGMCFIKTYIRIYIYILNIFHKSLKLRILYKVGTENNKKKKVGNSSKLY